jgi:hypothetical protein
MRDYAFGVTSTGGWLNDNAPHPKSEMWGIHLVPLDERADAMEDDYPGDTYPGISGCCCAFLFMRTRPDFSYCWVMLVT